MSLSCRNASSSAAHGKSSAVIPALLLDEAVNTVSVTSLTLIPGEAYHITFGPILVHPRLSDPYFTLARGTEGGR